MGSIKMKTVKSSTASRKHSGTSSALPPSETQSRMSVLGSPSPEIRAALKVLSGKWTLMILCQLSKRTARFNELRRTIPGITQHMLTSSLRDLEGAGVVNRTVYAEVPPRVEYAMTAHGRSLKPVIEALAHWGRLHLGRRR